MNPYQRFVSELARLVREGAIPRGELRRAAGRLAV